MKIADIVKDGKTVYAYSTSRDWMKDLDVRRVVVISDQRFSPNDTGWSRRESLVPTTDGEKRVFGIVDPQGRSLLVNIDYGKYLHHNLIPASQIIGPWDEISAQVEEIRWNRKIAAAAAQQVAEERGRRWAEIDARVPGIVPKYALRKDGPDHISLTLEQMEKLLASFGVELK